MPSYQSIPVLMGLSAAYPRVGSKAEGSTAAATRQLYGGGYGYPSGDVAGLGLLGDSAYYHPWTSSSTATATQDNTQMTLGEGMMALKQLMQPVSARAKDTSSKDKQLKKKAVDLKQTTDAVRFKVEMPGFNKENVKVYLEGANVVVKGVRQVDPEFDDDCEKDDKTKTFSKEVDVSSVLYTLKTESIKAVLKDGILKVTIPKVKHEDRTDVIHVQLD